MMAPLKQATRRLVGDAFYRALAGWKLRARHWLRWILGLDPRVRTDREPRVAVERHGDWFICPAAVPRGAVVYSVGIGRDLSFDLSLIDAFGARIVAFDPTPDAIDWARSQRFPEGLVVREVGLAAYDGSADFSANEETGNPSFSFVARGQGDGVRCEVRRLSTLMAAEGHQALDVLKLDIEGAEYDVIDDILRSGVRIRQLLVEFHHRKVRGGSRRTAAAVASLRAHGFRLVHVSPGGQEFVFLLRSEASAR